MAEEMEVRIIDVYDVADASYVSDVNGRKENVVNDVADVNKDVADGNEGKDNDVRVSDVNDVADVNAFTYVNESKADLRARMIARMREKNSRIADVADVNDSKGKLQDSNGDNSGDKMSEWKQEVCGCLGQKPFGCGNCDVCLLGWCCGCWLVKKNAKNMGRGDGLLCCLLSMCIPFIPVFIMRLEAREKYGIEGNPGDDFVCSFCCTSCINCQTAMQIREEGDNKDFIYLQNCNDLCFHC